MRIAIDQTRPAFGGFAIGSLAAVLLGCATADPQTAATFDGGTDATADASDVSPAEGGSDTEPEEGPLDALFETEPLPDSGPKGVCALPKGSSATATTSSSSTPDQAIDGDLGTYWNAGGYSGFLRIQFPSPTRFDRVRIAATALPACDETYTLTGFKGTDATALGTFTRPVPASSDWVPVLEVPGDSWDAITLSIAGGASWAAVAEVDVYHSTCPGK